MLSYDPRLAGADPPCTSRFSDKSVLVFLLPDLEQHALYGAVNHELTILGRENRTLHWATVEVFACPSDAGAGFPRPAWSPNLEEMGGIGAGETLMMTRSSYAACAGSYLVAAFPRPANGCRVPAQLAAQSNGAFGDVTPIRIAGVRDGLSQTIFFTEKSVEMLDRLEVIDPLLPLRFGWYVVGNMGDALMTAFYPPGMPSRVAPAAGPAHAYAASSQHPGGFHALMGDGSVRFQRETTETWPFNPLTGVPVGARLSAGGWWEGVPNPGVWQALATRSGGEAISSE